MRKCSRYKFRHCKHHTVAQVSGGGATSMHFHKLGTVGLKLPFVKQYETRWIGLSLICGHFVFPKHFLKLIEAIRTTSISIPFSVSEASRQISEVQPKRNSFSAEVQRRHTVPKERNFH
jgi:hypothetical protein